VDDEADGADQNLIDPDAAPITFEGNFSGLGLDLKIGEDGNIQISRNPPPADRPRTPEDDSPPDER
jgi:hypothetical protein